MNNRRYVLIEITGSDDPDDFTDPEHSVHPSSFEIYGDWRIVFDSEDDFHASRTGEANQPRPEYSAAELATDIIGSFKAFWDDFKDAITTTESDTGDTKAVVRTYDDQAFEIVVRKIR